MPHPLSLFKLPVLLVIYFTVNIATAQVYSSSISAATGGTGRAAVEPGDAAYLNPAALVHLRGKYLFSSFAKEDLAIVLSDNSEDSFLPAALGYLQKKSTLAGWGDLTQQDVTLSLAEFVVDRWALGVTGHYLEHKFTTASYQQTNADLGLLFTPRPHIGVALVVYNVFGEKNDVPKELRTKTTVGFGFNYIYQSTVRFRFDATSESVVMTGLETYLNKFLITRFGYSHDLDDHRELLTAGAGFKGPKFALNYAYQGNSQISGDYRHSVDLEIPF